jgi:hypothetical protein
MPTIPGPKLIAIGQIILRAEDAEAIRILDSIWKNRVRTDVTDPAQHSVAYKWEDQINISYRDGRHILAVLQSVAGMAAVADPDRAKVVTELVQLWRMICRELQDRPSGE